MREAQGGVAGNRARPIHNLRDAIGGHFELSRELRDTHTERAVARMLESPENRDKLRLPEGVGDVRIENGELVVAPGSSP
jgi:hypothetical protein